jgi:hypothetical protein
MGLSDLSLVTASLLNLLRYRLDEGLSRISGMSLQQSDAQVLLSSLPSDEPGGDLTIRLYLYHVTEDAYLKNQPPVSSDPDPVRYNPMGLQLYYQLTAHAEPLSDALVGNSQKFFGLAMKAFHDYPFLDKAANKEIGDFFTNNGIVPLPGTDDILRITLMHTSPEQAEQFWSSSSKPVRLAAYYMVTAVLLEPEEPQQYAGRVLQYGVQTFVQGAPRLIASHNIVTFQLPTATAPQSVNIQPAEAATSEAIYFDGIDLSGDVPSQLMIKGASWDYPVQAGADWSVVATADSISAKIGSAPVVFPSGNKNIVPGLYTASAQVTVNRLMPDSTTKSFTQTSNAVPFTVAPSITTPPFNAVATAISNVVTVTGGIYQDADVLPENVQVIVGGMSLPLNGAGPLSAGNFEIVNASTINFQFPIAGLNPGNVPLRIIVNGAECGPRWVTVP